MKYKNNKIVYEVGDWITSVVKDDSYFTMGSVGQLSRYDGRDWWVYPSHTGNPDYPNMCVGKEYLFRPATQEEINKATEEEKIMWGQYEVNFNPALANGKSFFKRYFISTLLFLPFYPIVL